MGRPKALLPFRGQFLGAFVAGAVRQAAGSATLIGNPQFSAALGFPAIPDAYPGEGPLGGILTALRHTGEDWNLVTACDMPGLSADFLCRLLATAENLDADALIPKPPLGRPEPLCAVYHRRSRQPLEAAFLGGTRKVTEAFKGLRAAWFETTKVACFQNVNTPEDWARYASE